MKIEGIAKVAYEVNAAYAESLGDNSFTTWEQAPQWQRDTNIKGVEFIRNNPNASPSASHNSWLIEKRRTGWKYGPVKDEAKKEHPCFVEYDKLPPEQKAKDYIFGAVVRGLLPYLERMPTAEELEESRKRMNTAKPSVVAHTEEAIASATTVRNDGKRVVDLGKLTAKQIM